MYLYCSENVFMLFGKCIYIVRKMYLYCSENVFVLLGKCIYIVRKMYLYCSENVFVLFGKCIYIVRKIYFHHLHVLHFELDKSLIAFLRNFQFYIRLEDMTSLIHVYKTSIFHSFYLLLTALKSSFHSFLPGFLMLFVVYVYDCHFLSLISVFKIWVHVFPFLSA